MTEILKVHNPELAAEMILRFIEVADHLCQMRNYNSLSAIMNALVVGPITQLKNSWEIVDKAISHKETFDKLAELTSPVEKYKNYRNRLAIHSDSDAIIPLIGPTCSNLALLEEVLPTVQTNGWINWHKLDR